jgi:membrane-associated protein
MQSIATGVHYLHDLESLVAVAGAIGLVGIIFAETGLLVGFFLPGDSLLLASGLFVAKAPPETFVNVWVLGLLLCAAAIVGDFTGFHIGRKAGPFLFERKDSFFFRKSHILRAQEFYDRHGGKTIILARFVPIVRTFAPTIAGIAGMNYFQFALYNVVGAVLWIWSFLLAGYFLATQVPGVEKHLHLIVLGVIIVSVMPIVIKGASEYRKARASRT